MLDEGWDSEGRVVPEFGPPSISASSPDDRTNSGLGLETTALGFRSTAGGPNQGSE